MGFTTTFRDSTSAGARSTSVIQLGAVGLSVLLTVVTVAQDHMPNNDGVLYLYSAELISSGRWADALQLFNWPFYSILIAMVHQLTGFAFETSAYLLNGFLQALLVFTFIGVADALGGDRKTVLSAALVILIFPGLNEYRSEIIRDFGYWAFATMALLFFLKSKHGTRFVYVAAWTACLVLAALFRVEGLVLIGVFPLLLLMHPDEDRALTMKRVLAIYGAYLAVVLGLVLVVMLSAGESFSLKHWNKPLEILGDFYAALSSDLEARAQILKDHYLIRYSHGYASVIVVAIVLIILLGELFGSIGPVFLAFAAYGLFSSRSSMLAGGRWAVLALIAVNFFMLAAFVAMLGFLAGRYPMALTLLLLLFAASGVLPLYRRLRGWGAVKGRAGWVTIAFVLATTYLFVDGVATTSPGKVHVEQASDWLREHLAAGDRVLSNDYPLLYRSGKIEFPQYLAQRDAARSGGNLRLLKEQPFSARLEESGWDGYQYAAIRLSRKDPAEQGRLERVLRAEPVQTFSNSRGDRVLVFSMAGNPKGPAPD